MPANAHAAAALVLVLAAPAVGGRSAPMGAPGASGQARPVLSIQLESRTEVRAHPGEGGTASGAIEAGKAVTLVETRGEWMLVRAADGREGWARSSQRLDPRTSLPTGPPGATGATGITGPAPVRDPSGTSRATGPTATPGASGPAAPR